MPSAEKMHKLISQGAEAKIFLTDDTVKKERVVKSYRIKEIDDVLRHHRTRKEGKVLHKLASIGFPSPKLLKTDEKSLLEIEYIPGKLLKDTLTKNNCATLGKELGALIAIMHNADIIHGDLTTSNMIVHEKNKNIYLIDFGLSFTSLKEEDRAVDLHVLKEALLAKHPAIWEETYHAALAAYKKGCAKADEVMARLKKVEERGRYRAKKGS